MSRQVRQNIRNFLLPMSVAEAQRERDLLLERGDTVGAGYADEFIRELEAEQAEQTVCAEDVGNKDVVKRSRPTVNSIWSDCEGPAEQEGYRG